MDPVLDTSNVPPAPAAPAPAIDLMPATPPADTPPAADTTTTPPADVVAVVDSAQKSWQETPPDNNNPVTTDVPPKSEDDKVMAELYELLGIPSPTAEAAVKDPVTPPATTPEGDEFTNPNNEPAIFRKEIDSLKQAQEEVKPKVERLSNIEKILETDPMLKALVEKKLAWEDVDLSKVLREALTKRLQVAPRTEQINPTGTAPKAQTLQQMIAQGSNTGLSLAPERW